MSVIVTVNQALEHRQGAKNERGSNGSVSTSEIGFATGTVSVASNDTGRSLAPKPIFGGVWILEDRNIDHFAYLRSLTCDFEASGLRVDRLRHAGEHADTATDVVSFKAPLYRRPNHKVN